MDGLELKKTSLSVEDAAQELGVGVRTIINYLHSGKLQGNKVGKRWFINEESFRGLVGEDADSPIPQQKATAPSKTKKYQYKEDGPRGIKLSAFKRVLECSNLIREQKEKLGAELSEKLCVHLEYSLEMIITGYFSFGQHKISHYLKAREGLSRGLAILYMEFDEEHFVLQAYLEAINATVALSKRIQNENKKRNQKDD
ncbi:helix-turn-helix domain-containing protein [bacterium]|nr:helix-turn-helix domain-containing protein [bacterium]